MLTEGHINERFLSEDNKILLLDYLLTELKSARMTHVAKPEDSMQVTIVRIIQYQFNSSSQFCDTISAV